MDDMDLKREYIIRKYDDFINRADSGLFTTKTRKRLAGRKGMTGRERTINDFWYGVRKSVKAGLLDLGMFIDVADEGQIEQVITIESLKPIFLVLLRTSYPPQFLELLNKFLDTPEYTKIAHRETEKFNLVPNRNRAEIAESMIRYGFTYLKTMAPPDTLPWLKERVDEAMRTGTDLAQYFKPLEERKFSSKGLYAR